MKFPVPRIKYECCQKIKHWECLGKKDKVISEHVTFHASFSLVDFNLTDFTETQVTQSSGKNRNLKMSYFIDRLWCYHDCVQAKGKIN